MALALFNLPGSAHARIEADIGGVWSCCGTGGAGQQNFVIASGTGSVAGVGKTPTGSVFATITGSVSGNSVTIVTTYNSFSPGYVATFVGTVSPDGNTMSGTWTSNQHQSGTWTATRVSGSGVTPPDEGIACVEGCSNFQFDFDSALDPGQQSEVVGVGCDGESAPRTTASAGRVDQDGCMVALVSQIDPEQADSTAVQEALNAADQAAGLWKTLQGTQEKIFKIQQDVTQQKATDEDNDYKKFDQYLHASTDAQDATALATADGDLADDFPGDTTAGVREPASAASGQSLSAHRLRFGGPNVSLVLRSIYETHPTAADIKAFSAELALATAPTYSPKRAEARLTLLVAVAIGRGAIAHDLGYSVARLRTAKPVVLGKTTAHLEQGTARRLEVVPSALGGRILRLLTVVGLAHRVSFQLAVSESTEGKTKTATVVRPVIVK